VTTRSRSGTWECESCGRLEDERAIDEQVGYWLCRSCHGQNSDKELMEIMQLREEI
jgi:ribosomal protein L37AE/L43A